MSILHMFIGPRRYAQGAGALAEAGRLIEPLGNRAFVLYDRAARDLWARQLRPALAASGLTLGAAEFTGGCSRTETDQFATSAHLVRADIVIGLGGGGPIDAAKTVAADLAAALVIIPTLASANAPTSVRSATSTDRGTFDPARYRLPDLVLVDTQVIANAPVRPFIAALGDALATCFEARATAQSYSTTMAGGWPTIAAGALARACWETLRRHSREAVAAVRAHRVTDAVEKIVEATTLLSGLGAENGGLAAAHAIHNGLVALPETDGMLHGEKVAFGVQAMLELEKGNAQERREVLDFCLAIGLPVCFADLGAPDVTHAALAALAERALASGETIYNEPCALSPTIVIEALRSADARGRAAKAVASAA